MPPSSSSPLVTSEVVTIRPLCSTFDHQRPNHRDATLPCQRLISFPYMENDESKAIDRQRNAYGSPGEPSPACPSLRGFDGAQPRLVIEGSSCRGPSAGRAAHHRAARVSAGVRERHVVATERPRREGSLDYKEGRAKKLKRSRDFRTTKQRKSPSVGRALVEAWMCRKISEETNRSPSTHDSELPH